jgi:hypothetical protein
VAFVIASLDDTNILHHAFDVAWSSLRIGIAATALGSMSCTVFAQLDGFTGGAPASTDTATNVAAGDAGDLDAARDAASVPDGRAAAQSDYEVDVSGDAAGGDAGWLIDDDFESGITCQSWQAAYGTAEPVAGGYESARSCLICRDGDIYVDRTVAMPGPGTIAIEAWSRLVTTTAPASSIYVHAIFQGPEGLTNRVATSPLSSTWTKSLVSVNVPAGVPSLKLRVRVQEGCFLLDRVRAQFEPAANN